MRIIRSALLAATILAAPLIAVTTASAQDWSTSLRGFRLEGNLGGDWFYSQGTHRSKLGYGATIGFDGMIGDKIVIGPEASIWRAQHGNGNCAGYATGTLCIRSYNEYGAAIRAGYLIQPQLLLFAKGGYANNKQRGFLTAPSNLYYLNGQIVRINPSTTTSSSIAGYQFGGGAEYSLNEMVYTNAQYVYSHYESRTSRGRAYVGIGVRFK